MTNTLYIIDPDVSSGLFKAEDATVSGGILDLGAEERRSLPFLTAIVLKVGSAKMLRVR